MTLPNITELMEHNRDYVAGFSDADLSSPPGRQLAIVACMDARLDPYSVLGLSNGDAHIIRNAGGVVSDDAIRSLCLSQRALGTREIVLIHHTECGLCGLDEAAFRSQLIDEVGVAPSWSLESFSDPYDDVRQSIERLRVSPFVPHTEHISGFVYDVATGELHRVDTTTGQ